MQSLLLVFACPLHSLIVGHNESWICLPISKECAPPQLLEYMLQSTRDNGFPYVFISIRIHFFKPLLHMQKKRLRTQIYRAGNCLIPADNLSGGTVSCRRPFTIRVFHKATLIVRK